jgi:hypothetical protein
MLSDHSSQLTDVICERKRGVKALFPKVKGREISPKVPVGAGCFVQNHSSQLAGILCERERVLKVVHVRM